MGALMRTRRVLHAAYPLLRPWHQRPPAAPSAASLSTQTQPHARERNVVYSHLPPVPLPTQDLPSLLYDRLSKWRHLEATECAVTGRKYTYGEVLDKGLKWGAIVNRILPAPSPSTPPSLRTVTIFCKNCPEFQIFLFGSLATGVTVATINSHYTAEEVARQLAGCEAGLVVTEPGLEAVLGQALARLRLGKKVPVFVNGTSREGHPNVRELLDDPTRPFCDLVESSADSTAVMLFSSGTTGVPKGVMLSHRAFTSNLAIFTHPKIFPYHPPAEGERQDTITGVLPFYHIYGLYVVTLLSMYQAAKVVSFTAFDPAVFVRVIREHKVRIVHMVPPILNFLTMSEQVTSADLESVRGVMCAAAPVPVTTVKLFKQKAPNPVIFQEGFGMTEILGTHVTPLEDEKLGHCGKVVPNVEAKVINEEGEALPEGERGEMCIRSPSVMTGYYKNPEATAETLDAAGWLHTGDVAVHKDGFFSIVDRIKELIKTKGFQISPSELEDVILQHDGVKDVAVVGVPDERAGELPRAYVIRSSSSCSEDDLHKFLKERVADFKQLRGGVRFVESLPRNPTGKVMRKELMEMAAKDP